MFFRDNNVTGTDPWSWKAWHSTFSPLTRKTHNASLSCGSSWAWRTIRALQWRSVQRER